MGKKRWIPPRWSPPRVIEKTEEDEESEEIIKQLRIRDYRRKEKKKNQNKIQ